MTNRTKVTVDVGDLKAVLSLLDAYANKEKAGAHFKDDEQRLPDSYFAIRVDRIRRATMGKH